jgi:hypothetical protein
MKVKSTIKAALGTICLIIGLLSYPLVNSYLSDHPLLDFTLTLLLVGIISLGFYLIYKRER